MLTNPECELRLIGLAGVAVITLQMEPARQERARMRSPARAGDIIHCWHIAAKAQSSVPQVDELLKQLRRVASKRLGYLTKLDHVQAALAPLHLRHEALGLS